jgi:hypothetical protein
MSDVAFRLLVVAGVVVVAVVAALTARRLAAPRHPPLRSAGVPLPPGLVVFTATTCDRCREALSVARATGVPLREITYELEAELFATLGVDGVPLMLIVDQGGIPRRLLAGVPARRTLRRELAAAGW